MFGVLFVVAVASLPALQIYLWGDDFVNLDFAFRIHEDPMNAFQMSYLFFRPLMLFSMYLSYLFFGTHVVFYNILTLFHHLVNVALLHQLMLRMDPRRGVAIAVAVLFGTTPLASEATTWSGARADVLLVTVVLSLLLFLVGKQKVMETKVQLGVLLLLVTGLCIKESSMVLPLLIVFFLILVNGIRPWTAIVASLPGWVLLGLYVFRFFVIPEFYGEASPLSYAAKVNGFTAMFTKFGILMTHFLSIGQFHGDQRSEAMIGLVFFLIIALVAILQRNRSALFGGVLMILALVPSIHFPVSPSRFNYLALIGYWMALVNVGVRITDFLERAGRASRPFLLGTQVIVIGGLTIFQVFVLQMEFRDYFRFGQRHRTLVSFMGDIEADLERENLVLLVNFGRIDGPSEFQQSVEGVMKSIYPRHGGLWNLVYFNHLADFDGNPFKSRFEEVTLSEIDRSLLLDCEVLIFSDTGFEWCSNCLPGIISFFDTEHKLPTGIRIYRNVDVVGATSGNLTTR